MLESRGHIAHGITGVSMQPDEFLEQAIDLFGEYWPSEIAKRTGINKRNVRHMAAGSRPIPEQMHTFFEFWRAQHGR